MKGIPERVPELLKNMIPAVFSVILAFITIADIFKSEKKYDNDIIITTTLIISILLFAFVYVNFLFLKRNPSSISIALIGTPAAGKTVFLTVLFDYLQRDSGSGIRFAPYGSETVEKVHTDLNTLFQGTWLPRTEMNEFFYYRAYASLNKLYYQQKYKIEIADFAGESIGELTSDNKGWLHKSEYFEYATQSDCILFAVDCSIFIDTEKYNKSFFIRDEILNNYISSLHVLADRKGGVSNRKIKEPVAIMFLKSDLLEKYKVPEEHVLIEAKRLIDVCRNRALYTKVFFVSSIGNHIDNNGHVTFIEPISISQPLRWALSRINS